MILQVSFQFFFGEICKQSFSYLVAECYRKIPLRMDHIFHHMKFFYTMVRLRNFFQAMITCSSAAPNGCIFWSRMSCILGAWMYMGRNFMYGQPRSLDKQTRGGKKYCNSWWNDHLIDLNYGSEISKIEESVSETCHCWRRREKEGESLNWVFFHMWFHNIIFWTF